MFMKCHTCGRLVWATGSRLGSQGGQYLCQVKMLDLSKIYIKYDYCTLYRSRAKENVKALSKTYR